MIRKRIGIFYVIFFLIAMGLIVRVSYLGSSQALTETAKRQQTYRLTINSERAAIYDRNLTSFTGQETDWCAVATPDPSVIDELKRMGCGLSHEELADLVAEGLPFAVTVTNPQTASENIIVTQTQKRYASNPLAVHTIGYINADGTGVSGIEKAEDAFLEENRHTLSAVCNLDGTGNFLEGDSVELTAQGNADAGVILTLDADMQDLLERCCEGIEKGAAVILDAQTAEILAMASFPDFSPDDVEASLSDENAPMVNRNLSAYSVGSTFKICTAAAALDHGIPASRSYTCTGAVNIDGQVFHCHNRAGHGTLTMEQAFVESCNPYFITLGEEIGAKTLKNEATALGFGREIQLADGMVADSGTLPKTDMSAGELANFSFGQGDLTATPLQIAQLVYAAAGDGSVIAPRLVIGTTTDGQTIEYAQEPASIQAISAQAAEQIRTFMIKTVEQTAAAPSLTTAGGKSGTAQTGRTNADGSEEYETWFAGFFPADAPQYIAVVLIEGGKSGTGDAGPVFARIADYITTLDRARSEQPPSNG